MRKKERKRGGNGEGGIQAVQNPPKDCRNWTFTSSVLSLCSKSLSHIFMLLLKEARLEFEFQVKIEAMDTGKDRCSGDFRNPSLLFAFPNCVDFLAPAAHRDFQSPVTIFPRVFHAAAFDTPFFS